MLEEQRVVKELIDDLLVLQKHAIKNRAKLLISVNQMKEYVATLQGESALLAAKVRKVEAAENAFREVQRRDLEKFALVAMTEKNVEMVKLKCAKTDEELSYMETRVSPLMSRMNEIDEQIQAHQAHHEEKRKLERNLELAQEVNGLLREVLQTTLQSRSKAGVTPDIELLVKYGSSVQDILGTL